MKPLSRIKTLLVPAGRKPRKILTGPLRGLIMELDLKTQFQIFVGMFERELHPWIIKLSSGILSAVDVGAADGEYTLYFLKCTTAQQVFSFEPSPEMISRIWTNLSLNGIDGSVISLSDKFVGSQFGPSFQSLDSLTASLRAPCLIKLDVDGGEVDVIRSASELVERSAVRFLIETHSLALEEQCIHLLERAGFATRVILPAWWRRILPEQRVIEHNRWLAAAKPQDLTI
jgi:hypothetical protein